MRDRILGDRAANAQQRASQRVKEVCKSFVPSVWVVQVTGVACSLHHHHFVIGQIAQVTEWHLPELMVLVTVNDQRWDLDTKITTIMKEKKKEPFAEWFPLSFFWHLKICLSFICF